MGPIGHHVFEFLNHPSGVVALGVGVVGIVLIWAVRPPPPR
jgi:hypothetical protein